MKKNVTIKRTNKKISILLCICMLLAVCLGIPASASTRTHSSSYSTSSTRYETTITGFMGQSMLKARATKSGSGANSSVTGYVENLNITKYSMEMYLHMSWGESDGSYHSNYYVESATTQAGAASLSVQVTFREYHAKYPDDSTKYPVLYYNYAEMIVESICPYPYDLPYEDIITYPSFY